MGRIYLRTYITPCYVCKFCETHIATFSMVTIDKVETEYGISTGFHHISNYILDTVPTYASFHQFYDNSGALDVNSPFHTNTTYTCHKLYCKCCLLQLGWSIGFVCIIMDSRYITKSNPDCVSLDRFHNPL